MKQAIQRIASLMIAVMVAFGLLIVPAVTPAYAWLPNGSIEYAEKMTLYVDKDGSECWYTVEMGSKLKGADKITVKSTKPKVAKPEQYDDVFNIIAKKPGKTTITAKVKKNGATKTYKIKVTVKKLSYSSPFKSFKIGKKKLGAQFKQMGVAYYPVKRSTKQKISISLKKGYELKKIVIRKFKKDDILVKNIKNNGEVKIKNGEPIEVYVYDKNNNITYQYNIDTLYEY